MRLTLRQFRNHEGGAIIVWFAITLPVVLGLFALSLDLGRFTSMHTELKQRTDAAALAAAQVLDRSKTAMSKANAAGATVINGSKFADSGGSTVTFVYADTYANLTAGIYLDPTKEADHMKAAWVQATTNPGTVNGLIIQVLGGSPTMTTVVQSTAASHSVACEVQPLFMCLPQGGTTLKKGQQVIVKSQPGSSWGAGNFGLLDPPYTGLNAAQKATMIKKNLASSDPDSCYINKLSVAQGEVAGPVREGLNARMDIFDNNPDAVVKVAPGPINFKGVQELRNGGSQCVKATSLTIPATGGMPRDTAFDGPYGNGGPNGTNSWAAGAATYWSTHYTNAYPGFESRFDMYLAEAGYSMDAQGNVTQSSTVYTPKSTDPEINRKGPVCAKEEGIISDVSKHGGWERRVIYAAMVDCVAHADWLAHGNSSKSPLETADIGVFFMTEPTNGQELYLEFVRRITKGSGSGKLHNIVQLYPNPVDGPAGDPNDGN